MEGLNNLQPFYIGQEVEYITGIYMPKGTKVIVTDIWRQECGCWVLNFENNSRNDEHPPIGYTCWICVTCGGDKSISSDCWLAESFRSIQKHIFPLMTFKEIVKKEEEQVLIDN